MKQREIDVILGILNTLRPKRCLEWGSGYSTLYFTNFIEKNAQWIAIEHNREWAERIDTLNKKENVRIVHVTPNRFPFSGFRGDGVFGDLFDYIEYPCKGPSFEFIFIDGRARPECVKKSYELLGKKGIVILHDANREYYHNYFDLFKHHLLLTDYRTIAGGLWIGSKSLDITKMIEFEKIRRIWNFYSKYGRLLRM